VTGVQTCALPICHGGKRLQGRDRGRQALITEEVHDIKDILATPNRTRVRNSDISAREAKEAYSDGCSFEENYAGSEMVVDKVVLNTQKGVTPSLQAYRSRNRNRSIATANQHLPQRWDRLNLHDVTHLLLGVRSLLNSELPNIAPVEGNQHILLAAVIAVMYWTASPLERVFNTRVAKSISELPIKIFSTDIFYCLRERAWAIGQVQLEQRRSEERRVGKECRTRVAQDQ